MAKANQETKQTLEQAHKQIGEIAFGINFALAKGHIFGGMCSLRWWASELRRVASVLDDHASSIERMRNNERLRHER